jgi:predicted PurR-regulated permease PerM
MEKPVARSSTTSSTALWIVAVIATAFLLRTASQLFIPIVLGVLISYALEPLVAWMARYRVPRIVGASLLLAIILGLAAWGTYRLRDDVVRAVDALPEIARRAREWVSGDSSTTAGKVRQAAAELQGTQNPGQAAPAAAAGAAAPTTGSTGAGDAMTGLVQRGVGSIVALAGHITVIFFLVLFLLISGAHFRERIVEVAGPQLEQRKITARIIDDINAQIQRFLLVRLVTAAVVALATWVVLLMMDVPQAAVWGILAGVFNSIPYFGPVIVSGGLLLVGVVQSGDLSQGLKMSAAALIITSVEGWLLTPPLIGKAERMHVVVVFLGVLVWTWIWGAWGTLLAVPMLVIVKCIADHVESLKPLSRLMAP